MVGFIFVMGAKYRMVIGKASGFLGFDLDMGWADSDIRSRKTRTAHISHPHEKHEVHNLTPMARVVCLGGVKRECDV